MTEGDAATTVSGGWRHSAGAPALVFFTSAAVLVLEIIAGRLVAPYVGVTLETYTGIIGTVLAGIALGTAAGGRIADRYDPRRILGPLLVAGGAASLLTTPIVTALGPGVARNAGGPVGVVLLAISAFVVPTALLSAVPPMVAKLSLRSTSETGTVVGGLSAAGTAGALVGTFATGFFFIATVPSRFVVLGVGASLVLAGLAIAVRARVRPPKAVLALAAVAGLAAIAFPSPCDLESRYYCVDIETDPARASGRILFLDNLRHSYVDLEDPARLEFRYARIFGEVINGNVGRGPVRALHIGGGGFTFPRWLRETRPGSTSTVLELDPSVPEVARERLGLRRGDDIRVRTGDARVNIATEPGGAYDLVVGDAFGGLSVPWHLTTVEMVSEIERTLTPDGVYVLNLIDGGPRRFLAAEAATLAARFEHVVAVAPPVGESYGNFVLAASDAPIELPKLERDVGTVLSAADVDRLIRDGFVLRDDFAPVDQLLLSRQPS